MGLFKNAFKGLINDGESKVSRLVKKHVSAAKDGMTGFKAQVKSAVSSSLPVSHANPLKSFDRSIRDVTPDGGKISKALKPYKAKAIHANGAARSSIRHAQDTMHRVAKGGVQTALTNPAPRGGLSRSRALHSTGSSTTVAENKEVASGGTLVSDEPRPYTPWDHPLMAAPVERWTLKGLI